MPDRSQAAVIAVNLSAATLIDLTQPPAPSSPPSPPVNGHSALCTEAYFTLLEGRNGAVEMGGHEGNFIVHQPTYIDFVFDECPEGATTSVNVRPIGIAFKYNGAPGMVPGMTGNRNMPVSEITFCEAGLKYPGRGPVISLLDNRSDVSDLGAGPGQRRLVRWGYYILCQVRATGAIIMIDPEVENDN